MAVDSPQRRLDLALALCQAGVITPDEDLCYWDEDLCYWMDQQIKFLERACGKAGPDLAKYPHKCPRCGGAAYIGMTTDHAAAERNETCR